MMFVVTVVVHVTVAPPPLPEPLHWSIAIGTVFGLPVTEQVTLRVAPPPLPEPLHWLTVGGVGAPDVFGGLQKVGSAPPPVPDSTHCTTVTSTSAETAGAATLLTIVTLQFTVPPPPLPEPLHCLTLVIGLPIVVLQVCGVPTPLSVHTVCVDVAGSPVRLLVIVVLHVTSWPPTLEMPLH